MDAYTSFAQVYDLFMDNVPYEQWSAFLCRILKKYGIEDGPVLDLGCGTGKLTRLMAKAGYDMTGVDSSAEMLQIALSQTGEEEILYSLGTGDHRSCGSCSGNRIRRISFLHSGLSGGLRG